MKNSVLTLIWCCLAKQVWLPALTVPVKKRTIRPTARYFPYGNSNQKIKSSQNTFIEWELEVTAVCKDNQKNGVCACVNFILSNDKTTEIRIHSRWKTRKCRWKTRLRESTVKISYWIKFLWNCIDLHLIGDYSHSPTPPTIWNWIVPTMNWTEKSFLEWNGYILCHIWNYIQVIATTIGRWKTCPAKSSKRKKY